MPAVTRIGDADVVHCSRPNRLQGSDNVFVNGIGVSRQGDNNTVHVLPGLPVLHIHDQLLQVQLQFL